MMQKEYEDFKKDIWDALIKFIHIYDRLDRILSASDKEYCVTVDNVEYKFYPPVTEEDKIEMCAKRKELIHLLMADSFGEYLKRMSFDDKVIDRCFAPLLSFTMGVDPKDMQLEKIDLKDLYEVVDENGEKIKSLPLDLESSYVQADLKGDHVKAN